jgi:hypothetical protein
MTGFEAEVHGWLSANSMQRFRNLPEQRRIAWRNPLGGTSPAVPVVHEFTSLDTLSDWM